MLAQGRVRWAVSQIRIMLRDSSGYLLKGIIWFTDRLCRDSFELTLKA